MNLSTVLWTLVLAVIVMAAWRLVKYYRRLQARRAAVQKYVDWAEKVLAAKADADVVSIAVPKTGWKGKLSLPDIVYDADDKVEEAKCRLKQQEYNEGVFSRFREAMLKEQLSDRIEAYLKLEPEIGSIFNNRFNDAAGRKEMATKFAKEARQYATDLLEAARAGQRQPFVALVDLVRETGNHRDCLSSDYRRLSGRRYQAPDDWDELVVRYFKTPMLDHFRGLYDVEERGSLRLLAARALAEQSLLLAQVVLAHIDSRSHGDRWQREVGELAAELAKLVHRLQVERKLVFA